MGEGAAYSPPKIKILNSKIFIGPKSFAISWRLTSRVYFHEKINKILYLLQRGPNKVPVYSMAVIAAVTFTFILVGEINTLAPIVTMPFLLTYACIDYAYFALAQTFDLQQQREERFYTTSIATTDNREIVQDWQSGTSTIIDDDLDSLFPERVRHKIVGVCIF